MHFIRILIFKDKFVEFQKKKFPLYKVSVNILKTMYFLKNFNPKRKTFIKFFEQENSS